MRPLLYILAIIVANIVTAAFQPANLFGFLIPFGTWFIGLTFFLRDLTQNQYGRNKTYLFILIALVLSAITAYILGDPLNIVFASALSFLVAETTDTEIYTRLKLPMSWRVFYSGTVGGVLDSSIFVIVGLSPVGAGFIPWEAVPMAIIGQVIIKTVMQGIGGLGVGLYAKR